MGSAELTHYIATLTGKRVLVVGDIMADRYVWGRVERISPEAPIPVVSVSTEEVKPGGAANVAANIASLGGRAAMVGIVGRDLTGSEVRKALSDRGVDLSGVVEDVGISTIEKLRVIAAHQHVVRVDRESRGEIQAHTYQTLETRALAALEQCDALLLSDYAKGALTKALCRSLIDAARMRKIPIVVDPKPGHIDWFVGATMATPNQIETEAIVGFALEGVAEVERAGEMLIERLQSEVMLITRGEHGMSLISKDGAHLHIPTHAREVYDVTGAGDTVVATLTLALAAGVPVEDACALANAAAGLVVGEVGVGAVTPKQLEAALSFSI